VADRSRFSFATETGAKISILRAAHAHRSVYDGASMASGGIAVAPIGVIATQL
jgi:hypothetical protein